MAESSLYHTLSSEISASVAATVPVASQRRLALLVTGIVTAQSCVQSLIAGELAGMGLTGTTSTESIKRRVRRTLNDPHLTADAVYGDAVTMTVRHGWMPTVGEPLVLILDESTNQDRVHLLRMAVPYRGGAIPLAWASWAQNQPMQTSYWEAVDQVLAEAARRIPPESEVVVVADRAYAVPNLIDRLQGYGWHWVLRITTQGSHRWRPRIGPDADHGRGPEQDLARLVAETLPHPGTRGKASGWTMKNAGWRAVHLVGIWAHGQAEPLVVISDLPAQWSVLALYRRRFWIEPGFRVDKSHGWDWEASQVRDVAHHQVLLVAMAWATLLVLCLGATAAVATLDRLDRTARARRRRTHTTPMRSSLCTLGMRAIRSWAMQQAPKLDGVPLLFSWFLPALQERSWKDEWHAAQVTYLLAPTPVRP